MTVHDPRTFLTSLLNAALAAADPARHLASYLPPRPKGRTVVVGAGKAAAAMAAAVEAAWDGPLSGLVICPYGHGVPTSHIEVVEAGHPVPDLAGFKAATRMLGLLEGLGEDDLVLALISGGGSSLMALPARGLTLDDKRVVNQSLLLSGAPIAEMNCVRKHLSAVKGGRLALAAWPAPIHALMVSDVPGDDPAVIASGPTVADPTTNHQALEIIRRYRVEVPFAIMQYLKRQSEETPKAGDERLSRSTYAIVTRPAEALLAAAEAARAAGVTPILLGDAIEGEAREVAKAMAGMALSAARLGMPANPPCVLLSGGECTVTVKGRGKGGPNGEFALALALALKGRNNISAIACDTDGMDGASGAAGAIILPDSLERARAKSIDPRAILAQNDSSGFFGPLEDLVLTGPTRTNVNDFRAVFIPEAAK